MDGFVESPHLPQGRVTLAAVGEIYAEKLEKNLNKLGIALTCVPENPDVAAPVAYHADMSLFHCGKNRLITADGVYSELVSLNKLGFEVLKAVKRQNPEYPNDISLNACFAGGLLMHSIRFTEPEILKSIPEQIKRVNVRQAYTKCSVCVLDEKHIMTADPGIATAAVNNGVAALLIRPGFIELPGYDTGFIGGCCGKLAKDVIAFTGHLKNHPDSERISDFIKSLGLKAEYLTDGPAFDIGSLLPLKEARGRL